MSSRRPETCSRVCRGYATGTRQSTHCNIALFMANKRLGCPKKWGHNNPAGLANSTWKTLIVNYFKQHNFVIDVKFLFDGAA